jgi:hypothetical protein
VGAATLAGGVHNPGRAADPTSTHGMYSVFATLSDRLTGILTKLRSKGRLTDADIDAIGRCLLAARTIGERKGFGERGYRVSINCGPEGGQVVGHVHFQFTAGRRGSG